MEVLQDTSSNILINKDLEIAQKAKRKHKSILHVIGLKFSLMMSCLLIFLLGFLVGFMIPLKKHFEQSSSEQILKDLHQISQKIDVLTKEQQQSILKASWQQVRSTSTTLPSPPSSSTLTPLTTVQENSHTITTIPASSSQYTNGNQNSSSTILLSTTPFTQTEQQENLKSSITTTNSIKDKTASGKDDSDIFLRCPQDTSIVIKQFFYHGVKSSESSLAAFVKVCQQTLWVENGNGSLCVVSLKRAYDASYVGEVEVIYNCSMEN